MHILALNTYHGGSHQAFLSHWQSYSQHQWSLLTLPAHHWKWRMSHAAITFSNELKKQPTNDYDVLFCTDMLNLAEFIGLAPKHIQQLPRIIYFHENQLTYPDKTSKHKDLRYAFINFTSALAADEVWFNSAWHRDDFLGSLEHWLTRMPDFRPRDEIKAIYAKSKIHSPGIETKSFKRSDNNSNKIFTILWAARWEHDKNPQCFFDALHILKDHSINFRINVIGAASKKIPDEFIKAQIEFSDYIDNWGYANSKEEYINILQSSDVIVSTADHEFFGIAVMEAVAAGCIPVVPNRLAYPETLADFKSADDDCFYDGSAQQLAEKLIAIKGKTQDIKWRSNLQQLGFDIAIKHDWEKRAIEMDDGLSAVLK
jgi:glycosyltransferase involved in cell wall biosynthesis